MKSLQEIYANVPDVKCKGLCQAACGLILMSPHEAEQITAKHGSPPLPLPSLHCDKLISGRCSIYADRPLICRLFGAVKAMRCPHGCAPDKWLSDREAHALLDATNVLPSSKPSTTDDAVLAALERKAAEIKLVRI